MSGEIGYYTEVARIIMPTYSDRIRWEVSPCAVEPSQVEIRSLYDGKVQQTISVSTEAAKQIGRAMIECANEIDVRGRL